VKRIVDAYQGRTGVESRLGRGSTFWFELPKATDGEPLAAGHHSRRTDRDVAPS
jgi:light-regulated signal transduction histidine kinase (bacteriophytochrome)